MAALKRSAPVQHLTAEAIYRELHRSEQGISLATVYRVLTEFATVGLVARHQFDNAMAVFELNRGAHHDHIICRDCGRVEEFMDPDIENRQRAIAQRLGFTIQDHSLTLYARCQQNNCVHRKHDSGTRT